MLKIKKKEYNVHTSIDIDLMERIELKKLCKKLLKENKELKNKKICTCKIGRIHKDM
jgi:hypothetical protein